MSEDNQKIKNIDDAIKEIEESEHSCFVLRFGDFKLVQAGESEEELINTNLEAGHSYISVCKDNYLDVLNNFKDIYRLSQSFGQ